MAGWHLRRWRTAYEWCEREAAQYREGQRHALSSSGQLLPISLLLLSVRQLLVILNQLVDLWKSNVRSTSWNQSYSCTFREMIKNRSYGILQSKFQRFGEWKNKKKLNLTWKYEIIWSGEWWLMERNVGLGHLFPFLLPLARSVCACHLLTKTWIQQEALCDGKTCERLEETETGRRG